MSTKQETKKEYETRMKEQRKVRAEEEEKRNHDEKWSSGEGYVIDGKPITEKKA